MKQIFQLKASGYKLKIMLGVLGLGLIAFMPRTAQAFSDLMRPPLVSMLKEDYRQALEEFEIIELGRLSRENKAEVAHLKGLCLLYLNRPSEARVMFQKSLEFATKEMVTQNKIAIADSYYRELDYGSSLQIYKQLLAKEENKDFKCLLYYKTAKAYQKRGEWANADFYFAKVKKEFPESPESELVNLSTEGGNFFTIQVGSFVNESNARGLMENLQAKGYEAYILPVIRNGRELYRVRVGRYVSRGSADHVESRLRTEEHLPTYFLP